MSGARNLSHLKKSAFLEAYAKTGNISLSAIAVKCSRRDHYRWLKDARYARRFHDAHEEAVDRLEVEARKLSRDRTRCSSSC
jgi:hypothetical protein